MTAIKTISQSWRCKHRPDRLRSSRFISGSCLSVTATAENYEITAISARTGTHIAIATRLFVMQVT